MTLACEGQSMSRTIRKIQSTTGIALLLSMLLSGCSTNPELGEQDLLRTAGSAFMEGFLPTRVQIQNAITYPGYMAGRALAR